MLSRRELLSAIASAPLMMVPAFGPAKSAPPLEFVEEVHTIAIESAAGYRWLSSLAGRDHGKWIIAPGMRDLAPEVCDGLRKRVESGAWLLLESGLCFSSPQHSVRQLQILNDGFDLKILPSVAIAEQNYVSYSWPMQALVRRFEAVTPVVCDKADVIARCGELPVCLKKNMGRGCLVYLGSMLGPGLKAEEREAHAVGNALMVRAGA